MHLTYVSGLNPVAYPLYLTVLDVLDGEADPVQGRTLAPPPSTQTYTGRPKLKL